MPNMDGWETLRQLKASPITADIAVIVISISENKATGMALGATSYLVKPVTKELLLTEFDRLSHHRAIRNVLIVDDDPVIRDYLTEISEEGGYRVATVFGGQEALDNISA